MFSGFFFAIQPSYESHILDIVDRHKSSTSGYVDSVSSQTPTLEATYSALSINSILNTTNKIDNNSVTEFILTKLDKTTGLFMDNSEPSLEATYAAIGSLAILNRLQEINTSQTIQTVLQLQTNDSLFQDVDTFNSSQPNVIGELDHLFEAVSILDKLFTNQSDYYLAINRTAIAYGLFPLQYQGGFKEGILYNLTNMRNAYYVTGIMSKLGPNIAFYDSLGLQTNELLEWIVNLYTPTGFKFHSSSAPSIEATAYAIMALERLGYGQTQIYQDFKSGIDYMMNALSDNYVNTENSSILDIIQDILQSMSRISILSKISQPFISQTIESFFTIILGTTLVALIFLILVNFEQIFKEDEGNYFEPVLQKCIQSVFESAGKDLEELSYLLGEPISQVVFELFEDDDSVANLRAISQKYEFIITYETIEFEPKKLLKYAKSTSIPIITFDFLDKEIFYTIDEAIIHLKEAK